MLFLISCFIQIIQRLSDYRSGFTVRVCGTIAYQRNGGVSLYSHSELSVEPRPRDFPWDSPCHITKHMAENETSPHLRGKENPLD